MKNAILALILSLFLGIPMFAQDPSCNMTFDDLSLRWRVPQNKIDFVCRLVYDLMGQENVLRTKMALSKHIIYQIIVEPGHRESVSDIGAFGSALPSSFEGPSPENGYRLILSESDFKLSEPELLALLCSQFADIFYDDNLPLWSWAGGHWYKVLDEKDEGGNFRTDGLGYFQPGNFLGKPVRNSLMFARELFVNAFTLLSLVKSGYLDPGLLQPPSIESRKYWHDLGSDFSPFDLRAPPGVKWQGVSP